MDRSLQQLVSHLAPHLPGLRFDHLTTEETHITMRLTTTTPTAPCPLCGTLATRVHSAYPRTLADLPWAGSTLALQLTVRKFFCPLPTWSRRIFTERLPLLAAPHARRTLRQAQLLSVIGFALGGQAGAPLATRVGLPVSPRTLLRQVRRSPLPPRPVPRVLGVDDFALRKGRTYGTILVDLEAHSPVDLLPDRTAETLAAWLQAHPGVAIISRDRSTEYARGATLGAPQAQQVADRFHLVKNLREAVERLLDRNRSRLSGIALPRRSVAPRPPPAVPPTMGRQPAPRSPSEATLRQARRRVRLARVNQVRTLHSQGVSILGIAQQLGLSRGAVYRYIRSDGDPTATQWRPQPSQLDPYLPYLYQRWQEGCENGVQLWRELREQGYPGSRKMVATWIAQHRRQPAKTGPRRYGTPDALAHKRTVVAQQRERTPSSRAFSYFLLRPPDSLAEAERATLQQLQQASPDIAQAYPLSQAFLHLMRQRAGDQLNAWLAQVAASELEDLQNFAIGLERDKAAVVAGLSESWSNGQVEGQVNRLKLKKREMYGRANFDLLRQRVLAAA
jgi:transposase